jgi:hypothetical protein
MPQARSTGSRTPRAKSSSNSNAKAKPAAAKPARARAAAAKKPAAATKSAAAAKKPAATTKSAAAKTPAAAAKPKAGTPEARLEAAAQRLRKLNERIIDAGKDAGETTLSSYEKALKAIASSIESGPGKSDVDWISHLATTQAKFLRDVTNAWTAAARGVLK